MPESCQQKTPASGCPLDTPSLPFPSGRYSALSLLPAKGTIQPNIASQIRYMFQSTHPRGVRPPLPSPLNRAFERQNARTSAFWAFFHAVFLKQTVFSLFFSQLPLRGFHWETSVSLRFPFFRFCSFLLSRGAVFQNTSGPSGSMAVLAPTCSSRFFQLAPRK